NVRYDAAAKRLYVGCGTGAIGVVDVASRKRVGEIKLAQHPESFQLEERGLRMFVNVPEARQIAVIDRRTKNVVATWPVEEARANFPMAFNEADHRLFVGCRRPARVLAYDTDSGHIVGAFATVGDADDMFCDAQARRLYVSGGEGFVAVHRLADHDRLELL